MKTVFTCLIATLLPISLFSQMAITTASFDRQAIAEGVFSNSVQVGNAYEVLNIAVDANMKDQVAEVSVTQTIYNPGNRTLEVEIFFPLPNNGIVQNFMMMVDGKEVPGKLLPKDEAQRIYEGIVRRKRDPALMEYVGYGLFKTSVFPIAIKEERDITVRYTQVCDRKLDMVNFSYPFGTQKFSARALKSVKLTARIESTEPIKSIYSPSDEIKVQRNGDKSATVKMEKTYVTPDHDFKMSYSLLNGAVGANVLSYKPNEKSNGYFMLLASPSVAKGIAEKTEKNVVFVLDRSGSMAGKKVEQSKKALEFVLTNLNDNDRFNIVTYDDRVESYKRELQQYNKENFKEAVSYVNSISAGGGTNIDGALTRSMEILKDDSRPNYVIFLTDGLPTAGNTSEATIADNCKKFNSVKARVFAFGVGNDVNARLLDRLSTLNGGASEYVKPHEDIETQVASLYSNISSPVMSDIDINFTHTDIRETYPDQLPDLFKGGQLMWVGQYNKAGKSTVTIKGKVGGKEQTFEFPVDLASHNEPATHDYLQKIWASRRVGYILNQIDLNGRNKEMVDELVKLSKEHGILTPYTAFLAREDVSLASSAENNSRATEQLKQLENTSGQSANAQREIKSDFMKTNKVENGNGIVYSANGDTTSVNTIKKIGNKTFYKRNGAWLESTITASEQKGAVRIEQFSSEYFELSKGQSAEFNQYLSFDKEVVVKLNGKTYNIYR
jgi:Ca-activated chloride channel family protein